MSSTPLRFVFDAGQEHQAAAVEAVAALFEGQPRDEVELLSAIGPSAIAAVPNRLNLSNETLLANLRDVQTTNGLTPDETLELIAGEIEIDEQTRPVAFPNFSVEMETGTGKTYVYIRTALELFRRYGLRKYVVVVPSIAVREGVLKTLEITQSHFQELFGNLPYRFYAYNSDNLTQVRQFALSDSVELMVMTLDAFNKAKNVIRLATDRLLGETPINLVQATRPILVLDEPQNMESELSVRSLALLDPLFAIRYSATHRNPYNLVYRLTPFEAYRQNLVKRIEVAGMTKEQDANQVFLRLDATTAVKTTVTAKVGVHVLQATGAVKEKVLTVRRGDDLAVKTKLPVYEGYTVEEINPGGGFVRFSNNIEVSVGDARGADKEAIFESQIRYTIEEHFRKQRRLQDRGIKVLSLFFIDRVAHYQDEDGLIRTLFDRAFDDIKQRYDEWQGKDPTAVRAAYFAQRRTREGETILLESATGTAQTDESAYDLIMKNKEGLLSFEEPVAFIFSHSALREGWDNPNVFQICTLNQTTSEMKKRQEIGRGARLAVDQTGARVIDPQVNLLTVVANQSYERYVAQLQDEIVEEFGSEGASPTPRNARERGSARLRKHYLMGDDFRELWDRISQRTRYAVTVDADRLIAAVLPEIDKISVQAPSIEIGKGIVTVGEGDRFTAIQIMEQRAGYELGSPSLPNLIVLIQHLMEQTTPPVRLTRKTLVRILERTSAKEAMLANPHEFATQATRRIREKLTEMLVEGIRYEQIGDGYEMTLFQDEVQGWMDRLVPAEKAIYDHVLLDSATERAFVDRLEQRQDVRLYVKLPDWFKVPTPVGEYNPDWAIVLEERESHGDATGLICYLIRETKSTLDRDELRPDERRKIECGERHFRDALGLDYKVATRAERLLPDPPS